MPKCGERQPWKVRYQWSNGVRGVVSRSSEDAALMVADEIRRAGELRDDATVTVTVDHA